MELRQLEYFLAIAKTGNMTAASKELHVSQPSLSVALKKLEEELGASLFDRDGKRLVINDNGSYLAQQAEQIKQVLRETKATLEQGAEQRLLTINCIMRMPLGDTGKMLQGFHQRHPDCTVRLGWIDSGIFEKETADLVLMSTPLALDDPDSILLGQEDYALLVPNSHPYANKDTVRLADMKNESFVISSGGKKNTCFDPVSMCTQAGFEPKIVGETYWFSDALNLAAAGIGCCIAPRVSWLAGYDLPLTVKTISDVHLTRYLYIKIPHQSIPTAMTWDFIDYLQDYLDPYFLEVEQTRKGR